MISNTIEKLFIVYSNTFLQKNVCFATVRNLTLVYGSFFRCLINVFFGIIVLENFVVFSNARSILQLMLCYRNLPKFDILTLFPIAEHELLD